MVRAGDAKWKADGDQHKRDRDARGAGRERLDGILEDFWGYWSATSRCPPPIPPNHNKAKALIGINKLILLQFAHTRTAPVHTCESSVTQTQTLTHTSLRASYKHMRWSVTQMWTVLCHNL